MTTDWQSAFINEQRARETAERQLDEKVREVESALNVLRYQNWHLQAKNIETQLLMNLANEMHVPLNFREALALYTSSVALVLPCVYAIAYLPSGDDLVAWRSAHSLFERIPMPTTFEHHLNHFQGEALPHMKQAQSRKELQLFDVPESDTYQIYRDAGIRSVVVVPLIHNKEVAAIAEFGFIDKQVINPEFLQMAQAAAFQVSGIIERQAQEKTISENYVALQKAHEELKQAQQQLLQSEKMASLGQLSAGVAHEINNPIGFVISNIDSLKDYISALTQLARHTGALLTKIDEHNPAFPLAEAVRSHWKASDIDFILIDLESLLRDSEGGLLRVRDIVANLKEFARADQNKREPTDLASLIDNTIKIVWNELKYKVELEKELENVPPVLCNAGQISQVLVNLLVNASQAIESHGRIIVRLKNDGQKIAIEVADNGKGMSVAVLQRIFEPFFTTKPVGIGTGLGLSIAYGIMQAHQGSIDVTSEEGKGTTFRLLLPLRATS